jgi:hypothetical protein
MKNRGRCALAYKNYTTYSSDRPQAIIYIIKANKLFERLNSNCSNNNILEVLKQPS